MLAFIVCGLVGEQHASVPPPSFFLSHLLMRHGLLHKASFDLPERTRRMWADLGLLQTKTVPETPETPRVLINFLFEVSSYNFVSANSVPNPNFT